MKPDSGRVIYLVLLCFAGRLNARLTAKYEYDTELIDAARNGQDDLISSLLDLGANVNHEDRGGRTALLFAAAHGSADVVSLLIEHGADINHEDKYGETALLEAARSGSADVVSLLLEHGAGVNHERNDGRTALFEAALSGNIEMVSFLVEHGSDINHEDSTGSTTLYVVLVHPRLSEADRTYIPMTDVISFLKKHGAKYQIIGPFSSEHMRPGIIQPTN